MKEDIEYKPYLGLVVAVIIHNGRLNGKLIEIGPKNITLERLDGAKVLIKRKAIQAIFPVGSKVAV